MPAAPGWSPGSTCGPRKACIRLAAAPHSGSSDTHGNRSAEWTERYGLFHPDKTTPLPVDQLPLVRAANGKQVDDFNLFVRNPRVPDGAFISVNATPLRRGDDLLKTVRRVQRRVRHIVDIIRTQETFTSGTVEYKLARPGSRRRHRGGSPDTAPFRTG